MCGIFGRAGPRGAAAALLLAASLGAGLPLPAFAQAAESGGAEAAIAQARPPAAAPAPTAAPAGRALLIKGPEARRGLPFFSPNAIPCLYGEYLVGTELLPLYYTKAALVLSESWRPLGGGPWPSSAGLRAYSLPREEVQILLLAGERYSLFLVLPREAVDFARFALALERRFGFFFDNAAGEAELSFPASVDFKP